MGQPIRRWYKEWKPANGELPQGKLGDLYTGMMAAVEKAVGDRKFDSVTFVWMQGERDARESGAEVSGESFMGLIGKLSEDLGRDDINLVIGRLGDFNMQDVRYPHWTRILDIQVKLAEGNLRGEWVNTDDLNGGKPGVGGGELHYTKSGYVTLWQRFAEKAIALAKSK